MLKIISRAIYCLPKKPNIFWKYSVETITVDVLKVKHIYKELLLSTYVSGLHSYKGKYIPFRGRKSHNDVQFNATIIRQSNGNYVIFNKWYEPDLLNRKGGWETGDALIR